MSNALDGAHPDLVEKIVQLEAATAALGCPVVVVNGRDRVAHLAFMDMRPGHFGAPSVTEQHPWNLLGSMARWLGLRWGGDQAIGNVDRGRVELP